MHRPAPMPALLRRTLLLALLACATAPTHAAAQTATQPPATPKPATPHPTPAKPKPAAKPAPKPAAKLPTIRPKPGPAQKPVPHPAAAPTPAPAPEPPPPEPTKGSVTGNPLPRFAALRTDDVNMRTGPGTRYPIDWVYKRRDLPVLIEREFEVWRLVRDAEGIKGWVHGATLVGRRTAVVAETPTHAEAVLRNDGKDTATPVARLKPGVILRLRSCEATSDWCQAQIGDYRGWIRRADIWGLLPGEAIQ